MSIQETIVVAFWLQIFGLIWNFIFLAIIGAGIYAFRHKIKKIIKDLVKEALMEIEKEKNKYG